jgi:hypothetical protein
MTLMSGSKGSISDQSTTRSRSGDVDDDDGEASVCRANLISDLPSVRK